MWGDALEMCKGIVQWFSTQVLEKYPDLNCIYSLRLWVSYLTSWSFSNFTFRIKN